MLARIAHELFWLGRYVARAEHTARMLDGVFQSEIQSQYDDTTGVRIGWTSLVAILGAHTDGPVSREAALELLTVDADEPASLISCVANAREGARTVRDVISADMWEALNTTHLVLSGPDLSVRFSTGPASVYRYVKERSALFWGLTGRTMLRDEASSFLQAGGRIESADMLLRMLRVALPTDADDRVGRDGQARALLTAAGGFQAFRRAVPAPPNAVPAARFLLYERAYPDSVAAAVSAAEEALEASDASPRDSAPVLRLSRLSAELEFRRRADDDTVDLLAVCERAQRELALVDADIAKRYFAGGAATVAGASA